jgi:hypothetical protein
MQGKSRAGSGKDGSKSEEGGPGEGQAASANPNHHCPATAGRQPQRQQQGRRSRFTELSWKGAPALAETWRNCTTPASPGQSLRQ